MGAGSLKTTVVLSPEAKLLVNVLSGLFNTDMKTLIHSAIRVLYEYVKAYERPPEVAEPLDSLIKYGNKVEKPIDEVVDGIVSAIREGRGFRIEGVIKRERSDF